MSSECFDLSIKGLRDAVIGRLGLHGASAGLRDELAWALLVLCRMNHPGIAVLLIRGSAARIVYHRRYVVEELKRIRQFELAKQINDRPVNDDELVIVALREDAEPRSCVLDIGKVRTKSDPPTLTRERGRTL
jgi:hypothetical protein